MATHSSVLAWRMPGTEEPGGLLSMGSHRVRHDRSDLAAAAAACANPLNIFQVTSSAVSKCTHLWALKVCNGCISQYQFSTD